MNTLNNIKRALTFDDVLLVPQESSLNPSDVSVTTRLTKKITLSIPILSAAMDTVTTTPLAVALAANGGLGVLHRNCTIQKQVRMVADVVKEGQRVAAACGPHDIERAQALDAAGVSAVVIDCAHAHKPDIRDHAKKIKKLLKKADLIVGNIVTRDAARMYLTIADALKVGIGPGSICTTRVIAGVGVPQLSAIQEVASVARSARIPVIADGGIKHSGDIVKALAAGASTVMIGSLFAGATEAPGERIEIDGQQYKSYRGMGSLGVMEERRSSDRYFQKNATKFVPEGVEGAVALNGSVSEIIFHMIGGLRSGMGYVGAKTIADLPKRAHFVFITKAGHYESHPHSIKMMKEAPNY